MAVNFLCVMPWKYNLGNITWGVMTLDTEGKNF